MRRWNPLAAIAGAVAFATGATALGLVAGTARAAEPLAPAGATATLVVEYLYTAKGRHERKDELDTWEVRRQATVSADLTARKPAPMPTLQKPDGAQAASMAKQGAQVSQAHAQMAPMMANAQAIVERCRNDQACIERETMKMGAAMAGTPQMDAAQKTRRETAAATAPDEAAYQLWQGTRWSGRWQLEEQYYREAADPICTGQPRMRCRREARRTGSGEWPGSPGGGALVEVDLRASRLALVLQVPVDALGFTETVTTTDPSRQSEAGTRPGKVPLRVTADGKSAAPAPLVVALKGGWRSQSGEQVVQVGGAQGEGGTLNVRWRFEVR